MCHPGNIDMCRVTISPSSTGAQTNIKRVAYLYISGESKRMLQKMGEVERGKSTELILY